MAEQNAAQQDEFDNTKAQQIHTPKDNQNETENKVSNVDNNNVNAQKSIDKPDVSEPLKENKQENEIADNTDNTDEKKVHDDKSEKPNTRCMPQTKRKTEEKDNRNLSETEVHAFKVAPNISIKFDTEKYLTLKHQKDSFVLYQISISTNTQHNTSWNLYLKYSEIDKFHHKLEYFHNRLLKFNQPQLKKTFCLPKIPPKKSWRRNKFDETFISQRIRLLNIYMEQLTKYVTNSSIKIQDLYLNFFQIDNIYKYIVNNDTEMLSKLHKYNHKILTKTDDNKSNILHYAIAHKSIKCIKWILQTIQDKTIINNLLQQQDQYHCTPVSLAMYIKNEEISHLLQPYLNENEEKKEEKNEESAPVMPAQYKYNVLDKGYKRNLWIFINPLSGTCNAQQVWEQLVKPFLDFHKQCFEYTVVTTNKKFHAQHECEALAADHQYDGILVIGGDGTISEVLNGLYYNQNVKQNDLCVTPIACGSGNALAKELQMLNCLNCLRKLIGGFETCIDAFLASQVDEKDTYCFVSTNYGVIASIDFDSEAYRWMGGFRFTMKAVSEIAYGSTYAARLYFKPVDKQIVKEFVEEGVREKKGRIANNEKGWWRKLEIENKENSYPSDWVCVEGDFGLLCVTNLQWIGEDFCMGGQDFSAKTNTLRLVYNHKTSRMNYVSIFLTLETGTHLDVECVKYYDVEQVVIEPLMTGADNPPMDVDGERKPLKPTYIKILPSDFTVTC